MPTKCPHKRFGEWTEACFVPPALEHGFSVSKPIGDSDGFDAVVTDRGEPLESLNFRVPIISSRYHNRGAKLRMNDVAPEAGWGTAYSRAVKTNNNRASAPAIRSVILSAAKDPYHDGSTNTVRISQPMNLRGKTPTTDDARPTASRQRPKANSQRLSLTRRPTPKSHRIQIRGTRTLEDGMYSVNFTRYAHRRYSPVDADFIAAFVAPENVWYIIPVSAAGFVMSIRVAPHRPSKAKYEKFREAWHLLRS